MKCEKCGAALQIEDEICPYCKAPNPFAKKHREDMKKYNRAFEETRQDITSKASLITPRAVRLILIAVLMALIILEIALTSILPHKIYRYRSERDFARNRDKYLAMMIEYEETGNWDALHALNTSKRIYNDSVLAEFNHVKDAADYFINIRSTLMYYYDDIYSQRPISEDMLTSWARSVSQSLDSYYASLNRPASVFYDDASTEYDDLHKAAFERLDTDLNSVLITYCNLTRDEVNSLKEISQSNKAKLIRTGMERRMSTSKEADNE